MVFEEFLGKNVRIIQTDSWTKYGVLERIEGGFLILRFDDGRADYISTQAVRNITEVQG